MKALNKLTAPKSVAPERIIQFGEGNFLRAFVDWIVYNMNQKTDFNSSVVVVQPIEKGMVEWLNGLPLSRQPAGTPRGQGREYADTHRLHQPRHEPLYAERRLYGPGRPA